ncbi:LysM peptidoglycan-binding domain-containing protein [Megasphaera cerevisiae]|uniref:LysM peptidoglycan-binding domain-containing protein n=1 Tax=Megasphaera cerevisiae TaxID=39029 RepID=UPI00065A9257|nr:LysM peptidoglycan-binding domain-containing protein [Megasphaera cerevisiae]SJZ98380.1 LysM domain-containing protein [Megasphaera cerevisiae DSM 20462]
MKRQKKRFVSLTFLKYMLLVGAVAIAGTQLGWMYHTDQEYVSVHIEKGQTIWDIASKAADSNTDVRYVVSSIVEANHLENNQDIYPGQVLQVPVNADRVDIVKREFSSH